MNNEKTVPEDVRELARKQCDRCGVTPTSGTRAHAEHVAIFAILADRASRSTPSDARVQELVTALERIRDSNGWESCADDLRDAAYTALARYQEGSNDVS